MMKYIGSYIQSKRKNLLFFAVLFLVFFTVSLLNNVPWDVYSYAYTICLFIGIIAGFFDFFRFVERHKELQSMKASVTLSIDQITNGADLIEEDYIELIRTVYLDKTSLLSKADKNYSETIDYFTMWAHQIKTPISGMRLLLAQIEQFVMKTDDMADMQNAVRELKVELFRIEQYVEMVLYYLRTGGDSTDYVIKEYELDPVIRGAVRKYASQFIMKKLTVHYEGTEKRVLTDVKWLSFVIEQILSNAIKYTEKGSIAIEVSADNRLIISDTGIGIAEEDIPRIFEKGYTGYNGRVDRKSTGIGLYLCHKILCKLGHSISVESEPGTGTKVIIGLERAALEMND